MALRVIAGSVGGRRLVAPQGDARPSTDRLKEALFASLGRHRTDDASVLDLYAGSGALAIEALSRGAERAVLVDHDFAAQRAILANLGAVGFRDVARFQRITVASFLVGEAAEAPFDVVFLDPPYDTGLVETTLQVLGGGGLLLAEGLVIAQHFTKRAPAATLGALATFRSRRFGETTLTFYRASGPGR